MQNKALIVEIKLKMSTFYSKYKGLFGDNFAIHSEPFSLNDFGQKQSTPFNKRTIDDLYSMNLSNRPYNYDFNQSNRSYINAVDKLNSLKKRIDYNNARLSNLNSTYNPGTPRRSDAAGFVRPK